MFETVHYYHYYHLFDDGNGDNAWFQTYDTMMVMVIMHGLKHLCNNTCFSCQKKYFKSALL